MVAMSRTLRRTPIYPTTSTRSEAQDKRRWHKAMRAQERRRLAALGAPYDSFTSGHRNAIMTTWNMAKDGKLWNSWRSQREWAQHWVGLCYGERPAAEARAQLARQIARGRFR